MKEEIRKIIEDYGQLHQDDCDLQIEDGNGNCTCAVKSMVDEIATMIVEFISHDMNCKDEEQRKAIVKAYLEGCLE
jgi:hypothetical protein